MARSTVNDGEMTPEERTELAREALDRLLIEMLRSLARGGDPDRNVLAAMNDFIEHATDAAPPVAAIINGQMGVMYDRALRQRHDGSFDDERKAILEASLRVVAESLASDKAARGRRSTREKALTYAIEELVLSREERSRANGWSYLQRLTETLGKWTQKGSRSDAALNRWLADR